MSKLWLSEHPNSTMSIYYANFYYVWNCTWKSKQSNICQDEYENYGDETNDLGRWTWLFLLGIKSGFVFVFYDLGIINLSDIIIDYLVINHVFGLQNCMLTVKRPQLLFRIDKLIFNTFLKKKYQKRLLQSVVLKIL